jgi:hypothetical protein
MKPTLKFILSGDVYEVLSKQNLHYFKENLTGPIVGSLATL